jgi:hypothetical protein
MQGFFGKTAYVRPRLQQQRNATAVDLSGHAIRSARSVKLDFCQDKMLDHLLMRVVKSRQFLEKNSLGPKLGGAGTKNRNFDLH